VVRDPDAENYAPRPYQLVAAQVDGLTVSNFRVFDRRGAEAGSFDRGAFFLSQARRVVIDNSAAPPAPVGVAPVCLEVCEDVSIDAASGGAQ
jgi:hypothetical protein